MSARRQVDWSGIRGVLFDKDGTLIDYQRTWIPANRKIALLAAGGDAELARALLAAGGHDPDTDRVAPGSLLAAGSNDEIAACFATVLGPRTPPDLPGLVAGTFAAWSGAHAVLIDGGREALSALRAAGVAVGLATNDHAEGLMASLRVTGLDNAFDFVVAADSGHGSKPSAGMALAFARAVGLPVAALAVVGDAVHDLAMARAAGYGAAIAVLSGTGTMADLAPFADIVLDSVSEVPALLTARRDAAS